MGKTLTMKKSEIQDSLRIKINSLLNKIEEAIVDDESQVLDVAMCPLDMPEKLAMEFLDYLKQLLVDLKCFDVRIDQLTDSQLKYIEYAVKYKADSDIAYQDAQRRTLWERITNSNNEDILIYKQCQLRYAEYLLRALAKDFLEDVVDDETFIL